MALYFPIAFVTFIPAAISGCPPANAILEARLDNPDLSRIHLGQPVSLEIIS